MRHDSPNRPGLKILAPLSAVLMYPFLISGNDAPDRVEQVERRGNITMLTRNGASSYFLGAEGETGPEYELVSAFAEYLGVDVEVRVADSYGQLSQLLNQGQGELIAANMTATQSRKSLFEFGPSYDEAHTEVVYRRGTVRPRSIDDLEGLRIAVIADSSYDELLRSAAQDRPELIWEALPDVGMEDLLLAVSEGEIDITLVDSNILQINSQFYPRIRRGFTLEETQPQAWAFSKDNDDTLVQKSWQFMALAKDSGALLAIQDRFYENDQQLGQVGMFQFLKQVRNRLPPLMPTFQDVSEYHDLDWRLLAAMGYQESHWDPDAQSRTGVRGIMMLTQKTAGQLGLSNRLDPQQSIEGGARYFIRMKKRIPGRINDPDRTWFALAAYNIGFGHMEDARVLTQRQGGNPDSWHDVSQRLPLLMQEKWYKQTKYGYARGLEAQTYVRNIRNYYDILVWMDTREHPLLVADQRSAIPTEAVP